ncbi:MAG: FAD-dependent oxidoreductase, partial [Pseudomonadales bacterium]|nr:FAD-dependent oxidoreductase [Pseudomonadales bacterium]
MSVPPIDLLPDALRERTTALNRQPVVESAAFVLYWMRTSVRGHENPALDAALLLGRSLGVPVFVYHALSERYPFASDRHHRFILEGARDVQAELAARGIGYAFHLERPGHRGDHLLTLASRAAAVVTESFPWTPIRAWTRRVAHEAPVGTIGVDAACLVPMRTVPADARDRAFRFRKATRTAREAALAAEPEEIAPEHPPFLPDLPFEPVDLATADLAELVAACAIDHTVGPVPHTPGGSRAGYARWEAFRDGGLRRYDKRRNDPLADGVSRLSPYLHYGHVSPFRVAREAAEAGGSGAEKFLDELLIWREMSWAWCFHEKTHDTLEALPAWARETLAAHAEDRRPTLHGRERLARGRTGDALWDAAQRSLVIHGELHNNVRMTWGKMIPQWSPDPETALARLIDLNHRYALDGRDPNSYGGLLWCLGGFDRPFDPERPVLGRVRPRDTATHARRLDVAAYAAHTGRAARPAPPRVAVIGAGVAGLVAARTLADHGWPVALFDKGRRPGGRLATRRSRTDARLAHDHGAPMLRAGDPRFRRAVDDWVEAGVLAPWPAAGDDAFVPVPDASALGAHLAADLDPATGVRIEALARDADGWTLTDDAGEAHGPFDALVLALPPAQAAALLRDAGEDDLAARLAEHPAEPCWTALVQAPEAGAPFDLLAPEASTIALAVREDAKPGRDTGGCFTVHTRADWARAHLEDEPDAVATALAPELSTLLGV